MAESTEMGIASLRAQEKSTMSTESALVTFLVSSQTAAVPASVQGTSRSARCSALLSREDFNFSDSSIMVTIFSNLLEPFASRTQRVMLPSSTTVPA